MAQQREARFIQEAEADPRVLEGKRVAVIGYGNLGRPLALNMRDSGVHSLIIGELPGPSWDRALADGLSAFSARRAAALADVVFVLLPDEVAPGVYQQEMASALRAGSALVFASGYNLAYGLLQPAQNLDVLLIAPRMIGAGIRDLYLKGQGFPTYVSVEQDATGQAWPLLLALARATGSLRTGALVLSAAQEAYLDLFIEQSVGPDLGNAILTAFQVGLEAGFPPEALVLEMYMSGEMARTFQAMADLGFFQQVKLHGFAAAYGGMLRTLTQDRESLEQSYRQVLKDIMEGAFTRELQAELEAGYPSLALVEEMVDSENPMSQAERRIQSMMRLARQADVGP